jgi:RNA polymerase sigma factor (sigma-70 family)
LTILGIYYIIQAYKQDTARIILGAESIAIWDDLKLIAELKNGSDTAFQYLVEHYQDRVFNTSLGLLQNQDDAEDITQEVFLKVFQSVRSFRGNAKLSTWIYRIAVTTSLDLLRSRKRKKRFGAVLSLFETGEGEEVADPSPFVHPGVVLENKERAAVLFQAMNSLPENQRVAFTLHKVEGLSYQEISGILNVSVPAVESLMHRAREKLREILADYYNEQK